MEALAKIEYPIIDETNLEDSCLLPKCKISTPQLSGLKGQIRQREEFNREINKIIEEGLVQRRLEHFRQKIKDLERNIYQREQHYKPVQLPRSFMAISDHRVPMDLCMSIMT